jgi:hypothetical protein
MTNGPVLLPPIVVVARRLFARGGLSTNPGDA